MRQRKPLADLRVQVSMPMDAWDKINALIESTARGDPPDPHAQSYAKGMMHELAAQTRKGLMRQVAKRREGHG